jgi:formylglycine-generating enzyme required for sulfatase activity
MGSSDDEPGRFAWEGPQTRVTFSSGFWMGQHEVTQGQYLAVMGSNPSFFTPANGYDQNLNRPVDRVNWFGAVNYCTTLTTQERAAGRLPSGYVYRLPTEAEWEYACRAGTATSFNYGPALRSGMANFNGVYEFPPCEQQQFFCLNPAGTYLQRPTTVGSYAPNAWGLYDMHGNVWEWCSDWWSASLPGGSVINPTGPSTGSQRVIRGGSWYSYAFNCRATERFNPTPDSPSNVNDFGFRVVLAPEQTGPTPIPNMSWIPAGTFTMGSPATEVERDATEGPLTQVTLSRGFWMGRYEVTQGEYMELMGSNPSQFSGNANRPVEKVTWEEARAYCAALTTRERISGKLTAEYEYRLPIEAEWEYACRAGTVTAFHYGTALRSGMADFNGQSEYAAAVGTTPNPSGAKPGSTGSVGRFIPNAWGLYDMHGGVWEWCLDWSSASLPGGSVANTLGVADGTHRVVRGGSWNTIARGCRSASRNGTMPNERIYENGFRLVLAPVRW